MARSESFAGLASEKVTSYDSDNSTKNSGLNDEQQEDVVKERLPDYKAKRKKGAGSIVILVEAAGRDMIWGIGLGQNNPKAQSPMTWRGRNLLGFALAVVRERLAGNNN